MAEPDHWDHVYAGSTPDGVSWYRPHLERSLSFIQGAALARDVPIIDVGGGASTLVDDLLDQGYSDITVLDISPVAIDCAKRRLGKRSGDVTWLVGDVTRVALPEGRYGFWHDRAVFHFLTALEARRDYVAAVQHALRVGGHIVVATFGPSAPERCSGLEVARYSADALHHEFGGSFRKVDSCVENHTTPWGREQEFVYCYCRFERESRPPDIAPEKSL